MYSKKHTFSEKRKLNFSQKISIEFTSHMHHSSAEKYKTGSESKIQQSKSAENVKIFEFIRNVEQHLHKAF